MNDVWPRTPAAGPDSSQPAAGLGGLGVNFAGYLRTESGVGTAARRYVRALQRLGSPLALTDLSDLQTNRSNDSSLPPPAGGHPYEVSIVCADAELHFSILDYLGEDFFRQHYTIAIWAWELPAFPRRWLDRLAFYDEVWVGSSFIANALAPVSPVPVVRIPPVLTRDASGSREAGRRKLGLEADEYLFLFIFDFHSHAARKNPEAVIDAFKRAFHPSEKARLALKFVNAESDPAGEARLKSLAEGHNISLLSGYWDSAALDDLMAGCDAYVSLHRSEGTGLTITDAMSLGKPVIATGWSGNTDFMDVTNSYPARYELVRLDRNIGPYQAGGVWAEANVEHAAELMRHVFDRREEALLTGRAGRQTLEDSFSEEAVAQLIGDRLRAIETNRNIESFREGAWQGYHEYSRLRSRLAATVASVAPAGAKVTVVSKGDGRLLELTGREASHFPADKTGDYAGYYPRDSEDAIRQLEQARASGIRFLVFPGPAFWWLQYYERFAVHLDAFYRRAYEDEDCLIFDLTGVSRPAADAEGFNSLNSLIARLEEQESCVRKALLAASLDARPLLACHLALQPPASCRAGKPLRYDMALTNRGRETWNAHGPNEVRLAVWFEPAGGAGESSRHEQRFALPHDVAPDTTVRLAMRVQSPLAPGSYRLGHQLVKEEIAWFDQVHLSVLTVEPSPPASPDWLEVRSRARGPVPGRLVAYSELVSRVRARTASVVPTGSTVLIVSKGDDDLLAIDGRRGWHFPRTADGAYAGHYPADSDDAVARLETLRQCGAEYLVLPAPFFWWLDFYAGLAEHLDVSCERVWQDQDCAIFRLATPSSPEEPPPRALVSAVARLPQSFIAGIAGYFASYRDGASRESGR